MPAEQTCCAVTGGDGDLSADEIEVAADRTQKVLDRIVDRTGSRAHGVREQPSRIADELIERVVHRTGGVDQIACAREVDGRPHQRSIRRSGDQPTHGDVQQDPGLGQEWELIGLGTHDQPLPAGSQHTGIVERDRSGADAGAREGNDGVDRNHSQFVLRSGNQPPQSIADRHAHAEFWEHRLAVGPHTDETEAGIARDPQRTDRRLGHGQHHTGDCRLRQGDPVVRAGSRTFGQSGSDDRRDRTFDPLGRHAPEHGDHVQAGSRRWRHVGGRTQLGRGIGSVDQIHQCRHQMAAGGEIIVLGPGHRHVGYQPIEQPDGVSGRLGGDRAQRDRTQRCAEQHEIGDLGDSLRSDACGVSCAGDRDHRDVGTDVGEGHEEPFESFGLALRAVDVTGRQPTCSTFTQRHEPLAARDRRHRQHLRSETVGGQVDPTTRRGVRPHVRAEVDPDDDIRLTVEFG